MNSRDSSISSPVLDAPQPGDAHDGKRGTTGSAEGREYNPRSLGRGKPSCKDSAARTGECVRIVVVNDHPIFRDGLRKLIESQPGLRVTGETSVGVDALRLARNLKPDVVLLDLSLPRRSGFQLLNDLVHLPTRARVLVLTEVAEESSILEAFYLGAHGVVLKGSPREALLKGIRSVVAGHYWLDGESLPILIDALRKFVLPQNGVAGEKDYGLTPRELKIVGKVANGSSNKQMGQEFSISERTVKHHLTNIFNKLGLSSRLELAVFALEHGLVAKGEAVPKEA